jgi:hypothetical protein
MRTPTPVQRREIGFERLSATTRWVVAGALGLAWLFTAAAAHGLPGHGKTTTPPAGGTSAGTSGAAAGSAQGDVPGSASQTGPGSLQPAPQAPTISSSPPQVVSGGS